MKINNEAELLNKFCDKSNSNNLRSYPFFNTRYGVLMGILLLG